MTGGGERWGNYVLEERIASGGMAEVFRAYRTGAASFSKQVCVKRLHAHLCRDPEFTALFLDEARTGAKLRHRNIVAIDDLGEHEGRYFLAMEYVNGVDLVRLEQRAAQAGVPIPVEAASFIVGEVLAALHAAHTAIDPDTKRPLRVVHRDVSPHNVLVSFSGEVKLTDFGIARSEGRARVTTGSIVRGKFGYMPLEQSTGGQVDGRADLFALGVTAFELLAGRRPFRGDDPDATLETIIAAQVINDRPRLSSLRPDLPPALVDLIERMLAIAPDDRPPDAASALEALQRVPGMASGGVALAELLARLYPGQGSVAYVPRVATPAAPAPMAPVKRVETVPFVLATKARPVSAPIDPLAPTMSVPAAMRALPARAPTPIAGLPAVARPALPRREESGTRPITAREPANSTTALSASTMTAPRSLKVATRVLSIAAAGMVVAIAIALPASRRGTTSNASAPRALNRNVPRAESSTGSENAPGSTSITSIAPASEPSYAQGADPMPRANDTRGAHETSMHGAQDHATTPEFVRTALPSRTRNERLGGRESPRTSSSMSTPPRSVPSPPLPASAANTTAMAPAAATGIIRVVSDQYITVAIDGRPPVQVAGVARNFIVPAGEHTLVIEGAVRTTRRVHVEAGRIVPVVLGD